MPLYPAFTEPCLCNLSGDITVEPAVTSPVHNIETLMRFLFLQIDGGIPALNCYYAHSADGTLQVCLHLRPCYCVACQRSLHLSSTDFDKGVALCAVRAASCCCCP
jgi:hypothetical protein